jgi:hypothetical protein
MSETGRRVAQGPQCNTDERKIPAAACDKGIPATECLEWHVRGRVPDAKMNADRTSCRLRCPNHDDQKPSLVISVGDDSPLMWHCHACGEDARLEVRAALVRVYGINPKCLPMSRRERAEQEEIVFAVFKSDFTPCTRLVCICAIHEGIRGVLPSAPALVELGKRAGVSRAQSFRARKDLGGVRLDHLFVPSLKNQVKDPKVAPAIRRPRPISDGDSVSNGDRAQSQMETGGNLPPAA